jgi:hypothetical protein
VSFDFLGYTFRARRMRSGRGKAFTGSGPAVSTNALAKCSTVVRSWRLHHHVSLTDADLARWINPIVRG